ncbi:C-type lectin domain family 12 member B-like isoform X1 [Poecilia formosa]|uniref:C-type lectin domain family 12 member B-like isoform X1 n=1 Tax=Poecilia formosa TaxID=48698 RepID=UPI0007B9DA57|nr:PREDICTED: C-type lectin domain family 12 member B-like isoform X1 [Poecilia formosa]
MKTFSMLQSSSRIRNNHNQKANQANFSSKAVEMAEDEVQYASVTFKRKTQPRANKQEEVVYDEVKIPSQTAQPTSDTKGLLSDEEKRRFCQYKKLACCFGILCVILVLAMFGVFVFLHKSKLKQLEIIQTALLKKNVTLTQQNQNLTTELDQVKKTNQELQTEKKNLTTELDQVKKINQELQTEKKSLTEQIESMKKPWNEQNVSQAQWIIDEYCPKSINTDKSMFRSLCGKRLALIIFILASPNVYSLISVVSDRQCVSCQIGWTHSQSSCYAVNDAELKDQKTWEEARENCRGKSSDLTVVGNEEEKTFLKDKSWVNKNIKGYWIGLRAEGGRWKWINGSDLTNQAWIPQQQATDGRCVTSLQNREWKSVSCTDKNAWICEKKALSI